MNLLSARNSARRSRTNYSAYNFTVAGDGFTAAFPGNAYVSAWTTACETTLSRSGETYPQTWCCPDEPGDSWSCVFEPRIVVASQSTRKCISSISSSTDVYVMTDSETSLDLINSESIVIMYHQAFPLQAMATTSESGSSTSALATGNSPSGTSRNVETVSSGISLGSGAIVGMVISVLA